MPMSKVEKFQSTRSMSAACRRYRARQRAFQHLIAHRFEQVIEEENGRARVDQVRVRTRLPRSPASLRLAARRARYSLTNE